MEPKDNSRWFCYILYIGKKYTLSLCTTDWYMLSRLFIDTYYNCTPLQGMNILKYNSTCNNKIINIIVLTESIEDSLENINFNYNYVFDSDLSQYSKEIIIYISGFVAKKLLSILY